MENKIVSVFELSLAAIYDCLSPEDARIILNYGFIAGGCFSSLYYDEIPNDYDFYFTEKAAADHFFKKFHNVIQYTNFMGKKFSLNVVSLTENAVTLFVSGQGGKSFIIQFVTKYSGTPEEIVSRFDFKHCMSYFKWDQTMHIEEFAIKGRELVFNENAQTPMNSILRIHKLCSKGWFIKKSELIKLGKAISRLNFSDHSIEQGLTEYY
jgi:hypothetical protein